MAPEIQLQTVFCKVTFSPTILSSNLNINHAGLKLGRRANDGPVTSKIDLFLQLISFKNIGSSETSAQ
jgi:hypothetical protein